MAKDHLKSIAAPKTWQIKRKKNKYITRPNPGAHSFQNGMSIDTLFKSIMKVAKTKKEVRDILNNKEFLVDGKRRKDHRFIVGLMDVISIPAIDKHYRVVFDKKGKLSVNDVKKEETGIKPCKIVRKNMHKNKIQIGLIDGKTILTDKKDYKVGDTLIIELPSHKIKEHLKFDKNMLVYLIGGKRVGTIGTVEDIKQDKISVKTDSEAFETLKGYAYVIGKDKPVITIE